MAQRCRRRWRTIFLPALKIRLPAVASRIRAVREARADVDAAYAMVAKAKADSQPTMSFEGSARVGDDIDGFRGETNDLQAGLVVRWDVFNGGLKRAKIQEMYRREREARFRLDQMTREAEEDVRVSWNAWDAQGKLVKELDQQAQISDEMCCVPIARSSMSAGARCSMCLMLRTPVTMCRCALKLPVSRSFSPSSKCSLHWMVCCRRCKSIRPALLRPVREHGSRLIMRR